MHSVVVHGHFYQPPRENPWLGRVEVEASAAPFHDWNTRIASECYEPCGEARLLDSSGNEIRRINLYSFMSFDAGPTLLRWLEPNAPHAYAAMLRGDAESAQRLGGHGNAIAMPYHHVILPLASRRDKAMEIRWGLADFRRRFGREPEGFWMPEAAVDEETLVVLAEQGIKFTIVSPHQVEQPPANGEPLRFSAGGGREIALFAYDGALASGVAFGTLLQDGDLLARALAHDFPQHGFSLSSLATDGETFGHHHKFGEMALARALTVLAGDAEVRVENFASILARQPPVREALLIEPSAWSCAHGVERWRSNCGDRVTPGTSQAWRRPLRAALNWLAREFDACFEAEGPTLFTDPWSALDAFEAAATLPGAARQAFVGQRLAPNANVARAVAVLDAMWARFGMFGSCAWFFDDVAGHETVLMLWLAAYAIERMGDKELERGLRDRLALALSNDPAAGNGRSVYDSRVLTVRPPDAA
jgi:alpha-amylase/alpha-mannosidase (GH57 family)